MILIRRRLKLKNRVRLARTKRNRNVRQTLAQRDAEDLDLIRSYFPVDARQVGSPQLLGNHLVGGDQYVTSLPHQIDLDIRTQCGRECDQQNRSRLARGTYRPTLRITSD